VQNEQRFINRSHESSMPRTSAAHATEMRLRILDGAHRAMLAGGYRGTTMPAIAAEADVSVGLLYRYFDSKEELYLAMCEWVTQAQLDELAAQMGQIADPRQRLARAVGHFVESLEAERWGAIITTGWAEADVNPALRDLLRRRCDQIRAFATMFLREAVARGEVEQEVDIEELSLAATMLMDGVVAHQAEMGDRFDPALVERSVIALIGRTLRR
jgi:AcrR family transcriptional regulator